MGMCKPSGGVKSVYGPYRENIKPIHGTPNSRIDYYDEITGKLLQQRWFGPDGYAIWDRDWDHSDPLDSHTFPHDHYWVWKNGKLKRYEYKGPNEETVNNDYY